MKSQKFYFQERKRGARVWKTPHWQHGSSWATIRRDAMDRKKVHPELVIRILKVTEETWKLHEVVGKLRL